ncbi:MAG TPA: hypothetical protein VK066_01320 [Chloroflexota bacterium]|nr:hypothetical protein [Chloroflexota bacterium]
MVATTRIKIRGLALNDLEARRIERQLRALGQRLESAPDPLITLLLDRPGGRTDVSARLRVRLGHLGGHLVSRETGTTADQAVRGAVARISRQLERQRANQRGEPTFGEPSRRGTLRPAWGAAADTAAEAPTADGLDGSEEPSSAASAASAAP